MARLLVGQNAYYDSMSGLILCKVLHLSGSSASPTVSIKVEVQVLKSAGAYTAGERVSTNSVHVAPPAAVRHGKYTTTFGHYAVGEPK